MQIIAKIYFERALKSGTLRKVIVYKGRRLNTDKTRITDKLFQNKDPYDLGNVHITMITYVIQNKIINMRSSFANTINVSCLVCHRKCYLQTNVI